MFVHTDSFKLKLVLPCKNINLMFGLVYNGDQNSTFFLLTLKLSVSGFFLFGENEYFCDKLSSSLIRICVHK